MTYGNVTINPASGGPEVAVDQIGGDEFQRIKLAFGGEGVATPVADTSPLPVALGGAASAGSALRVAAQGAAWSSSHTYGIDALHWDELLAGAATITHVANHGAARLTVTASASDRAVSQSRIYFPGSTGVATWVSFAFLFGAGVNGVTRRIGAFDDDRGVYLEQVGAQIALVQRTSVSGSPVNSSVLQASWNVDPLDGSGPSGETLDISRAQVLWVGHEQGYRVGAQVVALMLGGKLVPVHRFDSANTIGTPHASDDARPARAEILSDGAGAGSFDVYSCAFTEDGARALRGRRMSAQVIQRAITAASATWPILAIRPKLTVGGKENRILRLLRAVDVIAEGAEISWALNIGGDVTDGAWADVDATYSGMEKNDTGTTISGGLTLPGGLIMAGNREALAQSVEGALLSSIGLDISAAHPTGGLTDQIAIVATRLDTEPDVSITLGWEELW